MRDNEKTLRDEIAMSLLNNLVKSIGYGSPQNREVIAIRAYQIADNMIEARDGSLQNKRAEKQELKSKTEEKKLSKEQQELLQKLFNARLGPERDERSRIMNILKRK